MKPLFGVGEEVVVCPKLLPNFSGVVLCLKDRKAGYIREWGSGQIVPNTDPYMYKVSNDPYDDGQMWVESVLRKKPKGSGLSEKELMEWLKNLASNKITPTLDDGIYKKDKIRENV